MGNTQQTTNVVQSSGGLGLGTSLFLVFLVLKLTGFIAWSWWWVTAPLWAPALIVLLLLGGFVFAFWRGAK
ncbi:hypothetical protein ACWDYH_00480 [Nocardia goodfellowii]